MIDIQINKQHIDKLIHNIQNKFFVTNIKKTLFEMQ